jgi:hypothetical protein
MSTICAQELEGSGVTLTVLLFPEAPPLTGMIPNGLPPQQRTTLLDSSVMGTPVVFLASEETKECNGLRVIAIEWNKEYP